MARARTVAAAGVGAGLVLATEALIEQGFDDDAIARVMGGNVRRLLVDVLPGGIATVC